MRVKVYDSSIEQHICGGKIFESKIVAVQHLMDYFKRDGRTGLLGIRALLWKDNKYEHLEILEHISSRSEEFIKNKKPRYNKGTKSRQNAGILMGEYRRGERTIKDRPPTSNERLQNTKLRTLVGLEKLK